MNTKDIIKELKKSVLYQHKSLTQAVGTCQADKFILLQNRINVRTILTNIRTLENHFIFKKKEK